MKAKAQSIINFIAILIIFSALLAAPCLAIQTQQDWDKAFPSRDPGLSNPGASPGEQFAWHEHYWLRAYVSMAKTYGDTKYMNKAVTLIDHMFYYRDDARKARGTLNTNSQYYQVNAPLYYLKNPRKAAPTWRRTWGGNRRAEVLIDGMITQAIMRFVDLAYHDSRFASYKGKAAGYLTKVRRTVDVWDDTFAYNRKGIPGSYWFPSANGSGLTSTVVPYNHSATMGVTLLLLDDLLGGGTEYRRKAKAIIEYWRRHRRLVGGNAYDWNYYLEKSTDEDVNHAHIDLSFFNMAYRFGLLTLEEMQRLTNTLTRYVYKGGSNTAKYINGSGNGSPESVGYDWIDFTEFDLQALKIAKAVYSARWAKPTWARPFLGWAEILRWSTAPSTTAPQNRPDSPQNLRVTQ